MTRSNDFSDRTSYLIQCAIPRAMARVRDTEGKAPTRVKQFFVDKLKFNDNSNNEFSDCYYVSTLMSCLAESLISRTGPGVYNFSNGDEDDEASIAEAEFQKKAIDEIVRYRRIDEWIPTYRNTYSVTSMDCIERLMQSRTIPRQAAEFMQYTRPGNADAIRTKAFQSIAQLGFMANPAVLKYTVLSFAFDASPHMREQIWKALWLGLGHISFTSRKTQGHLPQQNGGLVVESDKVMEERQAAVKRTESVIGALAALRVELGRDEALAQATLSALRSPVISAAEFVELLDFCDVLYEADEGRLIFVIKYPRYWRAEHVGNAVVRFTKSNHFRREPLERWTPPKPQITKRPIEQGLKRQATEDHAKQDHPSIRLKVRQPTNPPPPPPPPQVQPLEPLPPPAPKVEASPPQAPKPPVVKVPTPKPQAPKQPKQAPPKRSFIVKLKVPAHVLSGATPPSSQSPVAPASPSQLPLASMTTSPAPSVQAPSPMPPPAPPATFAPRAASPLVKTETSTASPPVASPPAHAPAPSGPPKMKLKLSFKKASAG